MSLVRTRAVVLLAVCPVLAVPAAATEIGWSIEGSINDANYASVPAVDGLEFTPNVSITVTQLGWYDDTFMTAVGLAESHEVGVWQADTEQLLASAVVPAGTGAPLVNHFRFVDLAQPLDLSAGVEYIIAGLGSTQADPSTLVTPENDLIANSAITIGDWRLDGSSFAFPDQVVPASTRLMGPSFQFIVPEPTSMVLLPAAALLLLRRRRG